MSADATNPSVTPHEQTVVPILGMHRSGTSMVTRLLNSLGLELGEPLLDPGPDNPSGYWENTALIRINAEMLHSMGRNVHGFGTYQEVVSTPSLSQRITITDEKTEELRTLLADTFRSRNWGWKDPRSVLTWPVWKALLPALGYKDVRPLIIIRRPGDVVRSLANRRDLTPEWENIPNDVLHDAALSVWKAYSAILGVIARNTGCLVTAYDLFRAPETARTEMTRVATGLGLSTDALESALSTISPRRAPGETSRLEDTDSARQYDELFQRVRDQQQQAGTSVAASRPLPPLERVLQEASRLKAAGEVAKSVALLRGYVQRAPQSMPARCALAFALMETGHIAEAVQIADGLIAEDADFAEGHNLRGFGLSEQARIEAGLAAFSRATELSPGSTPLLSNILFASLYADHLSPAEITDLHRDLGAKIERNALTEEQPVARQEPRLPETSQRVRVGFLSADLRQHPVGYFMRAILQNRNAARFEFFCYHTVPGGDALTETLKSLADSWQDCGGESDDAIASRIAKDQVDVLVDLSGHTAANRSGVLARRPAPVQALYLGYPGTSGLSAIDYIISDSRVSPPEFDNLYTEQVARLDGCFLCFHPHESAPQPAPAPFEQNGFVTFGSFNHLSKISSTTVKLWSRVLSAVPDSRLVLKALALTDPGTQDVFADQFADAGILRERVDLLPPTVPLSAFLDEYRRIDITLDPVPYNGGTTTCESLWMGVPVISLPGESFCARMGFSILNTAGLGDFVAESTDGYVALARELAENSHRLADMRRELRDRVAESPLCDGQSFTENFERVLLSICQ